MNMEQEEIQFLGILGIIKESCNIISSPKKKIFLQITLTLILPLSFIHLAHLQISQTLSRNIMHEVLMLDATTPEIINTRAHRRISKLLTSDLAYLVSFETAYFVLFGILSLLSTSAVVYTVACVYAAKEITFKKLMRVVPRVWKRVMVTFIWNFVVLFAYNAVSVAVVVLVYFLFSSTLRVVLMSLFLVAYVVGLICITVTWHLADVVSVLEESYGFQALYKSKALIEGKIGIPVLVFLALSVVSGGIQWMFEHLLVVRGGWFGSRVAYGALYLVLMSTWMLFGLIAQTIVYFICKSYHHEKIDKSLLADRLEGEYVPLKSSSKDVQLHQIDDEEAV